MRSVRPAKYFTSSDGLPSSSIGRSFNTTPSTTRYSLPSVGAHMTNVSLVCTPSMSVTMSRILFNFSPCASISGACCNYFSHFLEFVGGVHAEVFKIALHNGEAHAILEDAHLLDTFSQLDGRLRHCNKFLEKCASHRHNTDDVIIRVRRFCI